MALAALREDETLGRCVISMSFTLLKPLSGRSN